MIAKIHQFWNWFVQQEAQFRQIQDEEGVRELLNNQILSLGRFAWGIDRGRQKRFALTFSPNNDHRLLALSKQIVEAAPDLPYWEFHACRPPDLYWDFKFQTFNNFMVLQTFDAAKWQFVLIEEEDYRIRIEIKADNMATLDLDDQNIEAERAVTRLLGDELRIEEVHSVAIVHRFDPLDQDWVYNMRELRKRFLYFIE